MLTCNDDHADDRSRVDHAARFRPRLAQTISVFCATTTHLHIDGEYCFPVTFVEPRVLIHAPLLLPRLTPADLQ